MYDCTIKEHKMPMIWSYCNWVQELMMLCLVLCRQCVSISHYVCTLQSFGQNSREQGIVQDGRLVWHAWPAPVTDCAIQTSHHQSLWPFAAWHPFSSFLPQPRSAEPPRSAPQTHISGVTCSLALGPARHDYHTAAHAWAQPAYRPLGIGRSCTAQPPLSRGQCLW